MSKFVGDDEEGAAIAAAMQRSLDGEEVASIEYEEQEEDNAETSDRSDSDSDESDISDAEDAS